VELGIATLGTRAPEGGAEVLVRWGTREECELSGGGAPTVLWSGVVDRPITLERGPAGDHRFRYGDQALFHLSAPLDELRCHPRDRDDSAWQRVLCDTVMFCTALLRGRRMLHAASVGFESRVVAIAASTGGGKSSLAWELIRGGASLFSDDVLTLALEEGIVVCAPGPPLMNLPAETPLDGLAVGIASWAEDGERWVRVHLAAHESRPLAAVVLLERRPGLARSIERIAPNPLPLLRHSIHLGSTAHAAAERFTLMSDVAERVPIFRLSADSGEGPSALALRMTDHLRGVGVI
jgi:hypothetical protein